MMYRSTAVQSMREKGEPTLPLINIVFLMLIFFLATAQMARPLDPSIELVNLDVDVFVPPPDAVVIDETGSITFRGAPAAPDAVIAALKTEKTSDIEVRILPDRRAPATSVISLAQNLHSAGAVAVFIVTEQALQ